jgi:beta-lactamase superfamily II metal-dependent hydrolase
MSNLRVRAYNVLQGDAFLITVPDKDNNSVEHKRYILIDVGNLNSNKCYKDVVKDIRKVTNKKVDLYVMTHEHFDHVEGLYYAKKSLSLKLKADYAWLTASADPNYYQNHPDSRRALDLAKKSITETSRFLNASSENYPQNKDMLKMNNFISTDNCVKYLRKIAPNNRTFYVHRGHGLNGKHPFKEAQLEVLAPEEETSTYYAGIRFTPFGVIDNPANTQNSTLANLCPPAGVDAGMFQKLVEMRRDNFADGLLSIDKAKNNTSIVFMLKWRGWKFLFTGDAEAKSWQKMYDEKVLEKIDFLKVGHHGSHNATPKKKILSKILPKTSGHDIPWAVIPVGPNNFGHPHKTALKRLKNRCDYDKTDEVAEGSYIDYEFPG